MTTTNAAPAAAPPPSPPPSPPAAPRPGRRSLDRSPSYQCASQTGRRPAQDGAGRLPLSEGCLPTEGLYTAARQQAGVLSATARRQARSAAVAEAPITNVGQPLEPLPVDGRHHSIERGTGFGRCCCGGAVGANNLSPSAVAPSSTQPSNAKSGKSKGRPARGKRRPGLDGRAWRRRTAGRDKPREAAARSGGRGTALRLARDPKRQVFETFEKAAARHREILGTDGGRRGNAKSEQE